MCANAQLQACTIVGVNLWSSLSHLIFTAPRRVMDLVNVGFHKPPVRTICRPVVVTVLYVPPTSLNTAAHPHTPRPLCRSSMAA